MREEDKRYSAFASKRDAFNTGLTVAGAINRGEIERLGIQVKALVAENKKMQRMLNEIVTDYEEVIELFDHE